MGETIQVNDIMNQLQKPFTPDEIEWRVGSTNQDKSKGLALAYVTNRAIQQRLDDVFGIFGWKNEFKEWKGTSQICGISVRFGDEWITKWDGADDSNMEATKGGLSDAMKRAAYQWGIGRYLYKLPQVWCEIKQSGKSYVLKDIPILPSWALPEGYQYKSKPKAPNEPDTKKAPDNVKPIKENSKDKVKPICKRCKAEIPQNVHDFSIKKYKQPLCFECQKAADAAGYNKGA